MSASSQRLITAVTSPETALMHPCMMLGEHATMQSFTWQLGGSYALVEHTASCCQMILDFSRLLARQPQLAVMQGCTKSTLQAAWCARGRQQQPEQLLPVAISVCDSSIAAHQTQLHRHDTPLTCNPPAAAATQPLWRLSWLTSLTSCDGIRMGQTGTHLLLIWLLADRLAVVLADNGGRHCSLWQSARVWAARAGHPPGSRGLALGRRAAHSPC